MSEISGTKGSREEVFLPFPMPRARLQNATHFRSTWLTASLAAIRDRGHEGRYLAALDPVYREDVLSSVAGVWLPMPVVRAHYLACDSLALPSAELLELGATAVRRTNATTLSMAARLARGAGVTPWVILAQTQRIYERTFKGGGGVAVYKLGPKDARIEMVGFPFASIRYNRYTMRGIVTGIIELFCRKGYVQEVEGLCTSRELACRVSWI